MGRKLLHDYASIVKEHFKGKTIKQLSKEHTIPLSNIYSYFVSRKIKYADIPNYSEIYKINHNYLDIINTEDKAYFLGIMLSDGGISGKNRIKLKLKSEDSYLIKDIFSYFSSGHSLCKDNNSESIQICSDKIAENLRKNGCINNKTKFGFNLPNISNELFKHFIRGYFDGDGSISKRTARPNQRQVYICSVNRDFLLQLQNKLKENNIETSIFKEKRVGNLYKTPTGFSENCVDMFTLKFGSHESRLKLYEFIYTDCKIKLERKFKLFNEYYVNTVLTLDKKGSKAVQRIDNETFRIDFEKLKTFSFISWEENIEFFKLKELVDQGLSCLAISKKLEKSRSTVTRFLKEYNLSTSARQPIVK